MRQAEERLLCETCSRFYRYSSTGGQVSCSCACFKLLRMRIGSRDRTRVDVSVATARQGSRLASQLGLLVEPGGVLPLAGTLARSCCSPRSASARSRSPATSSPGSSARGPAISSDLIAHLLPLPHSFSISYSDTTAYPRPCERIEDPSSQATSSRNSGASQAPSRL